MAEKSGTAVIDAPASPAADSPPSDAVPVEASPSAPVGERTPTPEPPAAPPREARPTPTPEREPLPVVKATPPAEPPEDSLLDWHAMIPADVRHEKSWEKYKSLPDALKALVHQERLLGEMIRVPKEGASDGQMRAFYERLGCPKHPGDYTITDPDMGQDADGNAKTLAPDFLTSLLDVAHQAGLRNEQAQQFINFAARTVVRSENIQAGEVATQRAQAERDLYEAFGGDAPAMIEKARMFVINMGGGRYGGGAYAERAAAKLKASGLGNDIDLIAAFANGFDNFREGIWVGEEVGGSLSSMEAMEADAKALAGIMNDEKRPYEERVAAQKKQYALFQQMNEARDADARRRQTLRR